MPLGERNVWTRNLTDEAVRIIASSTHLLSRTVLEAHTFVRSRCRDSYRQHA